MVTAMSDRSATKRILGGLLATVILAGCLGGGAAPVRSKAQQRSDDLAARAVRLEEKGDSAEALLLLEEALAVSTSVEDTPARQRLLINMVRIYRLKSEPGKARPLLDQLFRTGLAGSPHEAEAAYERASLMLTEGNSGPALEWAEKGVQAERGGHRGRRLNLLARVQIARQNLAAAHETARRALADNRASGAQEEEANSLRLLGVMARQGGIPAESAQLLSEALIIDKRLGVSAKIVTDLEELALTATASGDTSAAAEYRTRADQARSASQAATRKQLRARPQPQPETTSPSSKP